MKPKPDYRLTLRCRDCGALIDKDHPGTGCPVRKSGCCLPFSRWERPKRTETDRATQAELFGGMGAL